MQMPVLNEESLILSLCSMDHYPVRCVEVLILNTIFVAFGQSLTKFSCKI